MEIREQRLYQGEVTPIPFRESPNQSGEITPEHLVMHFTKGASAESSIQWLLNPAARASAHLVIGRDGDITQLVEFNKKAWHAGASRWEGRAHLNNFSIGIELDNYGDLEGGPGNWRTSWGRSVPDSEVVELAHKFDGRTRGWHMFPEKQLMSALEVAQSLVAHYRLKDVVGHEDVSPGRKWDPGPAFPMTSFRAALFGRDDETAELYAATTALNIRSGPGTQHEKLAVSPLPEGTRVEVLQEQGVWRLVDVQDTINGEMDIVGWVHGRYLWRVT